MQFFTRLVIRRMLSAAILLYCVAGCSKAPNYVEAEAYIREGDKQWAESVVTGDPSALERILADDFIGTNPEGGTYDKANMIADIRESPKYFASNAIGEITVRFFGEAAVAQGEESWVRHNGERGRFVWTDTWAYRNSRWQIVAAQDAIVKDKQ